MDLAPIDRRLVVALDFSDAEQAKELTESLGDSVKFYKIGLELLFNGGLDLAKELRDQNKWIFLDMKFLDIGNTVEHAVRSVSMLGFKYLTIHGHDEKTLKAAIAGKGDSNLGLLSVTVLTSLGKSDLAQQGITEETPSELAIRRAKMAKDAGFDGVIASGHEAKAIRNATSSSFIIKTPGIRLENDAIGDQVRIMTPRRAIDAGSNFLVVGRPITKSRDPVVAAQRFQSEIQNAFEFIGRDQV